MLEVEYLKMPFNNDTKFDKFADEEHNFWQINLQMEGLTIFQKSGNFVKTSSSVSCF